MPFALLQWANLSEPEDFPWTIFTFMAVHALLIGILLSPALCRLLVERSLRALRPGHWVGLLLGAFLGVVYAGVVWDQFPCMLGVPNCD